MSSEVPTSFLQIPDSVWIGEIFPMLSFSERFRFSAVSKYFRNLLFASKSSTLWALPESKVMICIDSYCPLYGLLKKQPSSSSAIRLISSCPLKKLEIHCFVSDIPSCLSALSASNSVESLSLHLSNKSNSPSLESMLVGLCPENVNFSCLRELIVDSSHLRQVNHGGRAALLNILGSNLKSLSFVGLSPSHVFHMISEKCANLTHLRVDYPSNFSDFQDLGRLNIDHLEILRSSVLPPSIYFLTALKSLNFSLSWRCLKPQVPVLIKSMPKTLTHLHIEIPGDIVNVLLSCLSYRLPNLTSLIIEGSYEVGVVDSESILNLAGCENLNDLRIFCRKSISKLLLGSNCIVNMTSFSNLESLYIHYCVTCAMELPVLLRESQSLRYVTLACFLRWMNKYEIERLENFAKNLMFEFPLVKISIQDLI